MIEVLERHQDKWEAITETGCFIWNGTTNNKGYGYVWHLGKMRLAHRLFLTVDRGLPPTLRHQASHLCHTPSCVNPAHLVWESRSENNMRKTPEARKRCVAIQKQSALGCSFHKATKKWRAQAWREGKKHHLGLFTTEAAAIAVYDRFTER